MQVRDEIRFTRQFLRTYFPEQKKDRRELILDALKHSHEENRLHHAYIFTGPEGVGKTSICKKFAAHLFAKFSNSLMAPSEQELLDRMERSGHPDLVLIEPEGDSIKVEQVRDLPKILSFAPLEAQHRVVAITKAHLMNSMAANALLKMLEEPPSHTIFFLLCTDKALLLPTIISRCQAIRFWAPGEEEQRSKDLLSNESFSTLRTRAIDELLKMWENCPRIPSSILNFVAELDEEDGMDVVLDVWLSLLRDTTLFISSQGTQLGQNAGAMDLAGEKMLKLYNADTENRIHDLLKNIRLWTAANGSSAEIIREFSEKNIFIDRFRVQLRAHVNVRIALENLVANMQIFSIGKMRQEM